MPDMGASGKGMGGRVGTGAAAVAAAGAGAGFPAGVVQDTAQMASRL